MKIETLHQCQKIINTANKNQDSERFKAIKLTDNDIFVVSTTHIMRVYHEFKISKVYELKLDFINMFKKKSVFVFEEIGDDLYIICENKRFNLHQYIRKPHQLPGRKILWRITPTDIDKDKNYQTVRLQRKAISSAITSMGAEFRDFYLSIPLDDKEKPVVIRQTKNSKLSSKATFTIAPLKWTKPSSTY